MRRIVLSFSVFLSSVLLAWATRTNLPGVATYGVACDSNGVVVYPTNLAAANGLTTTGTFYQTTGWLYESNAVQHAELATLSGATNTLDDAVGWLYGSNAYQAVQLLALYTNHTWHTASNAAQHAAINALNVVSGLVYYVDGRAPGTAAALTNYPMHNGGNMTITQTSTGTVLAAAGGAVSEPATIRTNYWYGDAASDPRMYTYGTSNAFYKVFVNLTVTNVVYTQIP